MAEVEPLVTAGRAPPVGMICAIMVSKSGSGHGIRQVLPVVVLVPVLVVFGVVVVDTVGGCHASVPWGNNDTNDDDGVLVMVVVPSPSQRLLQ